MNKAVVIIALGMLGIVSSAGAQTLGEAGTMERLRREALSAGRQTSANPAVGRHVLDVSRSEYPAAAWNRRIEGIVDVVALVDEDGSVLDVQIPNAAGYPPFREAADRSVRLRRQAPALHNGVPVREWISIRVCFRLP
jgi:TonB family protein